jgi:hypothetical protein
MRRKRKDEHADELSKSIFLRGEPIMYLLTLLYFGAHLSTHFIEQVIVFTLSIPNLGESRRLIP